MAFFNYPFIVTKDTPAVAVEVQSNFNELLSWLMNNVVQSDGTVPMTGPLVLAPGPPASPAHAANKAYVDAFMPVGVIMGYAGTSLPTGWLWCDGTTYTNTSQPLLAAAIGRSFTATAIPGTSFQVPDMRKRSPVGADASEPAVYGLGVAGGQRDSEMLKHFHQVPIHGHTASSGNDAPDHYHANQGNTGNSVSGLWGHYSAGGHTEVLFRDSAYNTGFAIPTVANSGGGGVAVTWGPLVTHPDHYHAVNRTGGETTGWASARHTHSVTVNDRAAFNTVEAGAGTALIDKNLAPYLAVNQIIYAGKG
jgi:microcystin-dependent protein